jgi:hypothetical protein
MGPIRPSRRSGTAARSSIRSTVRRCSTNCGARASSSPSADTASESPSKTSSSCPPTWFAVHDRCVGLGRPTADEGEPQIVLRPLVGGGVGRDDEVDPGLAGHAARAALDQRSSQIVSATSTRAAGRPAARPGHEVAGLVEDAVVGQVPLVVADDDRRRRAAARRRCAGAPRRGLASPGRSRRRPAGGSPGRPLPRCARGSPTTTASSAETLSASVVARSTTACSLAGRRTRRRHEVASGGSPGRVISQIDDVAAGAGGLPPSQRVTSAACAVDASSDAGVDLARPPELHGSLTRPSSSHAKCPSRPDGASLGDLAAPSSAQDDLTLEEACAVSVAGTPHGLGSASSPRTRALPRVRASSAASPRARRGADDDPRVYVGLSAGPRGLPSPRSSIARGRRAPGDDAVL